MNQLYIYPLFFFCERPFCHLGHSEYWVDLPVLSWRRAWQPSLQFSCLESPMDGGAWWATAHRVVKSQSQLWWLSMHACMHLCGAAGPYESPILAMLIIVCINVNPSFPICPSPPLPANHEFVFCIHDSASILKLSSFVPPFFYIPHLSDIIWYVFLCMAYFSQYDNV